MQPFLTKRIYIYESEDFLDIKIYIPIQSGEDGDYHGSFTIESNLDFFRQITMTFTGTDSVNALMNGLKLIGIRVKNLNETLFLGRLTQFKNSWPNLDPFLGFVPTANAFNIYFKDGKSYL